MPCFNSEAFIDATLRSLSEQLFQDYELIVVDDGSSDDTLLKVDEWRARLPSLQVIKSAQNLGPGDARNKGIELAHANLVALIDSDDVWFEQKLEMQVAVHAQLIVDFPAPRLSLAIQKFISPRPTIFHC